MKKLRGLSRVLLLSSAALVLPCCGGDVGTGDQASLITLRVSTGPQDEQGNGESDAPSVSFDGRYVAFASAAFNISPNDGNGVVDVLVKDRVTGQVENITNIPSRPRLVPGNSGSPVITPDGRYVAFLSTGNYQDIGYTPRLDPPIWRPFLYDRVTGVFAGVRGPDDVFNAPTSGLSLSADGRYMAFATTATNTGTATTGTSQVYLCDFGPEHVLGKLTLVSHATSSMTTAANASSNLWPGSISADGEIVVFESTATNLSASDTNAKPDVYYWRRSTGQVTLASLPSSLTRQSSMAGISADGSTIGYVVVNLNLYPAPGQQNCEFYSVATGERRTLTDFDTRVDLSAPVQLSADGTRALFAVSTTFPALPYLYIEGQGLRLLAESTNGQMPTVDVFRYSISGDGRWAGWATPAPNMVAGDSNGYSDIFLRGPF